MLSIAERHKYILDNLNKYGFVRITDVANELGVTKVTIRKDIKILESKGLLTLWNDEFAAAFLSQRIDSLSKGCGTERRAISNSAKVLEVYLIGWELCLRYDPASARGSLRQSLLPELPGRASPSCLPLRGRSPCGGFRPFREYRGWGWN